VRKREFDERGPTFRIKGRALEESGLRNNLLLKDFVLLRAILDVDVQKARK